MYSKAKRNSATPTLFTTPRFTLHYFVVGVRPMSISTSSNHSESSKTPPGGGAAAQAEELIQNQLSGIAHALLSKQPVRVQQLMALHNDKEVCLQIFYPFSFLNILNQLKTRRRKNLLSVDDSWVIHLLQININGDFINQNCRFIFLCHKIFCNSITGTSKTFLTNLSHFSISC